MKDVRQVQAWIAFQRQWLEGYRRDGEPVGWIGAMQILRDEE